LTAIKDLSLLEWKRCRSI